MNANASVMWDAETDALESVLAEWFPHGIQSAETAAGSAVTEDMAGAAMAVLSAMALNERN